MSPLGIVTVIITLSVCAIATLFVLDTGQTRVEKKFWNGIHSALKAGKLDYRFEGKVSERKLAGH